MPHTTAAAPNISRIARTAIRYTTALGGELLPADDKVPSRFLKENILSCFHLSLNLCSIDEINDRCFVWQTDSSIIIAHFLLLWSLLSPTRLLSVWENNVQSNTYCTLSLFSAIVQTALQKCYIHSPVGV